MAVDVDVGLLLYKAVNVGLWPQKLSNLWPSFTSCPLLWPSFTSCPLMWPSFTSRLLPAVIYMRIIPAPSVNLQYAQKIKQMWKILMWTTQPSFFEPMIYWFGSIYIWLCIPDLGMALSLCMCRWFWMTCWFALLLLHHPLFLPPSNTQLTMHFSMQLLLSQKLCRLISRKVPFAFKFLKKPWIFTWRLPFALHSKFGGKK